MNLSELRLSLHESESRIRDVPCRIIPTSFDPDDETLTAYPHPLDWRWLSCERALTLFKPTGVMMRLPLFWQAESPLHDACEKSGTSIFVNEPENMPIGGAAIQREAVDTVVTTAEDAFAFSTYLLEKNIPLAKNWLIINRVNAPEWRVPESLTQKEITLAQEVHLFPTMPLLVQCEECIAQKKGFHISDEYIWEEIESGVTITSKENTLTPLTKLQLPSPIKSAGTCACGKPRFE